MLQLVTGVVAAVLGVPVDGNGVASTLPRDGVFVTSQQRGDQIIVTVVPGPGTSLVLRAPRAAGR